MASFKCVRLDPALVRRRANIDIITACPHVGNLYHSSSKVGNKVEQAVSVIVFSDRAFNIIDTNSKVPERYLTRVVLAITGLVV
jgi:hypothetical protein